MGRNRQARQGVSFFDRKGERRVEEEFCLKREVSPVLTAKLGSLAFPTSGRGTVPARLVGAQLERLHPGWCGSLPQKKSGPTAPDRRARAHA